MPVQWAPKGFLITQFEHGDVEALGLPKMDLLGIRALTVLADAAELARRRHDPAFRLADIPLDDPATAALIERAETIGVFQCESDGAQRTLRKLKARTVADLAIANAFFKPGPAMGGMAAAFVRRYRGEEAVAYLHPALLPLASAHELSAINSHGYAPLFLVVADIVRFAREHDIPVSTRGSVANSLVAYCAGITTVDPIAHGLLFERFLNRRALTRRISTWISAAGGGMKCCATCATPTARIVSP